MSIRSNGRILGIPNNPTKASAPGNWDVDDQYMAGYGGNWKDDGDPFINNVILNVPANGVNGGANLSFLDSSPSAVTVTRNGDTYQGTFSPYAVNGWSAHFNGSSYLSLPTAAFNDAQLSTATFTMEAYVLLLTYGAGASSYMNRCIFGKGQTYLNFGVDSDGGLMLYSYDGSLRTAKAGNVPLGRWTHVAITVSSSIITFYINGTKVGTATYYGFQSAGLNTGAYVGTTADSNAGSNVQWIGFISNARFTTSVLYTGNFTPSPIPLQAPTSSTKLLVCHSYTWVDGSSTANAITISGSPRVTPISPFRTNNNKYAASVNGGSGYFDGTGDYLASTATAIGTNDFTVECWIYPTSSPSNSVILDTNSVDNQGDGVVFSWVAGTLYLRYFGSSNPAISITTVKPNAWYHVAMVRSGTTVTGYLNGTSVGSFTEAVRNLSSTKYTVGTFTTRNNFYFPGYLSDVRFTVGQALYTTNFTPPSQPLTTTSQNATASNVKYLLNFQNASIVDSSQKSQIYTVGALALSNAQSKYSSTSVYHNGNAANYGTIDNTSLFTFGTADFTIEFWVYPNSVSGTQSYWYGYLNGGRYVQIYVATNLGWYDGTSTIITSSTSVLTNVWQHIAATRYNGVANLWINGVNVGSVSSSGAYPAPSNGLFLGSNPSFVQMANCYMTNLRVTLGIARYTATFIPPQRANPLY